MLITDNAWLVKVDQDQPHALALAVLVMTRTEDSTLYGDSPWDPINHVLCSGTCMQMACARHNFIKDVCLVVSCCYNGDDSLSLALAWASVTQ